MNNFEQDKVYFPTPIQQFQFYDKYARYNHTLNRRETWVEAVQRVIDYLRELSENRLDQSTYDRIHTAILNLQVMPSMRLLAMAGPAARRNNMTIYNCSYAPIEYLDSFHEALLISMSGCGVGFSVESKYINQLPPVAPQLKYPDLYTYIIPDTTQGWAGALQFGIQTWMSGSDLLFDYSLIRPAGSPLRTKGGRASGPEPLHTMLSNIRDIIRRCAGRQLRPIDAHDMMCHVGSAAIAGGMRRTAMISLFDWDDQHMLHCKDGTFWKKNNQRWNANNSAVWPECGISQVELIKQMLTMVEANRGEPGIFNRQAAINTKPSRREEADFGTNPCGEIVLRPYQFCNLSIAVARPDDDIHSLQDKVELATIIGTIQSMATHFPGMRDIWRQNCEEERLIGVDITGQMDCKTIQNTQHMKLLQQLVISTNVTYARKLGINPATATTCVKPNGNSSVLLDCAPGLHARWSPYYVRNVRVSTHMPLFPVLRDANVPMDPENGQSAETATTWVIHFPIKSPDGAICRGELTALDQCETWYDNKWFWTEHNPSVTITYKPDEIIDLIHWIWYERNAIGGMAFLPASNAQYDQMPYEEIDKATYERLASQFPDIDFSRIALYEDTDMTTSAQEIACSAGGCDLV